MIKSLRHQREEIDMTIYLTLISETKMDEKRFLSWMTGYNSSFGKGISVGCLRLCWRWSLLWARRQYQSSGSSLWYFLHSARSYCHEPSVESSSLSSSQWGEWCVYNIKIQSHLQHKKIISSTRAISLSLFKKPNMRTTVIQKLDTGAASVG